MLQRKYNGYTNLIIWYIQALNFTNLFKVFFQTWLIFLIAALDTTFTTCKVDLKFFVSSLSAQCKTNIVLNLSSDKKMCNSLRTNRGIHQHYYIFAFLLTPESSIDPYVSTYCSSTILVTSSIFLISFLDRNIFPSLPCRFHVFYICFGQFMKIFFMLPSFTLIKISIMIRICT